MANIFLSYQRQDRAIANRLADLLTADGSNVWRDQQIEAGLRWDEEIERALAKATAVIVLWSGRSIASEWVHEEASYAREQGKLISVAIEDVSMPFGFSMISTIDLKGWTGDNQHSGVEGIRQAIKHLAKNRA
jgi:hypothetical protein